MIGMYIRTIKRKNKDGSVVEYVQLANNVWNKEKGFAQAQVIHSFGRSDQLDVDALRRLIKSMSRFLSPEDALALEHQDDNIKMASSVIDYVFRDLALNYLGRTDMVQVKPEITDHPVSGAAESFFAESRLEEMKNHTDSHPDPIGGNGGNGSKAKHGMISWPER